MIYELSINGYSLGLFSSEAAALRRVDYLPADRYTVREWSKECDFLRFSPSDNKEYHVTRELLNTAL